MSYLNEINNKISSLKGYITELEDGIKAKQKQIEKLQEELQELCLHMKENVKEEVLFNYSHEYQIFEPTKQFIHKRTCLYCGKVEKHYTARKEDKVIYKILNDGASNNS